MTIAIVLAMVFVALLAEAARRDRRDLRLGRPNYHVRRRNPVDERLIPLDSESDWLKVDMGPVYDDNEAAIKRIDAELNRVEWARLTSGRQGMRAPLLDIYDHQADDKSYPHGNWDPGQ